jgi:hypothetical protein
MNAMTERERMTNDSSLETSGEGPREARLQTLFAAADPQGEPSEALVHRVSELGSRNPAPRRAARGWPLRWRVSVPTAVSVARWCVAGLAVALLISLWPAPQQDGGAVAAALRASTAAPAMHCILKGSTDQQEVWFVAGAGCYLYGKNPQHETIIVDDMKHYYRYEIRERRVYVTPSLMADPKNLSIFWEAHSGAGLLKKLMAACGPKSVRLEMIRRDGRLFQQIVGPRRVTRITIDPETDRILISESDPPQADGSTAHIRYEFDYPDPAAVDRSHFQFKMPQGVTIVDQTRDR